jgi:hypothetical protein
MSHVLTLALGLVCFILAAAITPMAIGVYVA